MLSTKWKLYRIFTFAQLAYSGLLLTWFAWQMINLSRLPSRDLWIPAIVGSVILFMFINTIINIILLTKSFPNKALSGTRKGFYVASILMNVFTVIGLAVGCLAGLISELDRDYPSEDNTGIIFLTILGFITIVNLFLLVCQFGIEGYLKKNSTSSLNSLIDSIGGTDPRIH